MYKISYIRKKLALKTFTLDIDIITVFKYFHLKNMPQKKTAENFRKGCDQPSKKWGDRKGVNLQQKGVKLG